MTTTAGDNTAPAAARHGSVARSVLLHAAGTLLALVLLPLCLLAGVPFVAWAIAFALVVGNRLVQGIVGWAVRDSSLTVQLGSHGFSMIFRALFTAMTLFLVGASVGASGDRPVGLDRPDLAKPALLIFILCFTLDAGIEAIRRAGDREELLAMEMMTASTTVQEHPA